MRQKWRDAWSGPGMTVQAEGEMVLAEGPTELPDDMTVPRAGMARSIYSPTGGTGQPKVAAMTSVAFCPVVTRVSHCGMRESRAGTSVAFTTSRKASEALS